MRNASSRIWLSTTNYKNQSPNYLSQNTVDRNWIKNSMVDGYSDMAEDRIEKDGLVT